MRSLVIACVVLLACGVLAKKKQDDDEKVKIAVYYESLCPDSKKFIQEQLAPVWRTFRGSIKVKLVPYGKSTHERVNGAWSFNCHHGPKECQGNKIQSCVLKSRALQDTEKMDTVICLMSMSTPLDTCLSNIQRSDQLKSIEKCASGSQGDDLLAANGDKTNRVQAPLTFVPTIVINEHFDQANQDLAYSNLKQAVCTNAHHKIANCDS